MTIGKFSPSGAEAGTFRENQANTMSVDGLTQNIDDTSSFMRD